MFIALESKFVGDFGSLSIELPNFEAALRVCVIVEPNTMRKERERGREKMYLSLDFGLQSLPCV